MSHTKRTRRWTCVLLAAVVCGAGAGAGASGPLPGADASAPARRAAASGAAIGSHPGRSPTIVSLEFDHAFADQLPAIQLAARHGLRVTVFAISGRVGESGSMTAGQLRALQAQGDEVGGHTVDHQDLSRLPLEAQRHEICDDRSALQAMGLEVTDFAYPYGFFGAATPGIVRACGYQSARQAGGLAASGGCSGRCVFAETIPPKDPFRTRTADSVLETTRLASIEGHVRAAERHGGGWVQLVFHQVCDGCDLYSSSEETLARLVSWLAARTARGTRVETVRQVIDTPLPPYPIRIRSLQGRPLRVLPAVRCPSTPVTATCQAGPPAKSSRLEAAGGAGLTVTTSAPARKVVVTVPTGPGRSASRQARPAGAAHTRWRLRLPSSLVRGAGAIAVTYPLGLAKYRVRIARQGASFRATSR
jgi:peptidoglycan/xylan/chitin deacetylase (PgdA/CDA1 family)